METNLTQTQRFIYITLACIQNMTLGGLLFGWASISGTLLVSDTGGPGLSGDYVHIMFVISSFFNFMGPLLLGAVLDFYGPRICSILSITLIGLGFILFSVSDRDRFPMFIPAMCLISFGGPGAQSSIIHLSNLFPEWKATATAIITGSFQLSFIVFFIFDQLWVSNNISYHTLFLGYCVICFLNIAISFTLWPDVPFSYENQYKQIPDLDVSLDEEHHSMLHLEAIRLPSVFIHHSKRQQIPESVLANKMPANTHSQHTRPSANSLEIIDPNELTLYQQVFSKEFVLLTIFFVMNSFWVNFYIGTFDLQIGDNLNYSPLEKESLGRIFTITITMGVFCIPLVGAAMDSIGFPFTSAILVIFGFLWGTLVLSDSFYVLIASFVLYALFRTFFFTFIFAYLADIMGFKYYGVLAGIMFVLAGILGLFQYPLAKMVSGTCHLYKGTSNSSCSIGHWKILNSIMSLMIISTLYFSYHDWLIRKSKKEFAHSNQNNSYSSPQLGLLTIRSNISPESGVSEHQIKDPNYGSFNNSAKDKPYGVNN